MSTNAQEENPNLQPQAPREGDGEDGRPPQPRAQFSPVVFITLLLFMFFGGGSDEPLGVREQLRSSLQSLVYQHSNFTALINGTESNFTIAPVDRSVNPLLDKLLPRIEPLDFLSWSYYHNITGFLQGSAILYNLSSEVPLEWQTQAHQYFDLEQTNHTDLIQDIGRWNWTSLEKISITILEHPSSSSDVVVIHGSIELLSPVENDYLKFQLEGVHYPVNGTFYALVEPKGRHVDIRQITSMIPEDVRNITSSAIDAELRRRIDRLRALIDSGSIDIETNDDNLETNCSFQLYAQLPPSPLSQSWMQELEHEMDEPTGAYTPPRPRLLMDAVMLSKRCGLVISVPQAKGLKAQLFWRKTTTYAGWAFVIYTVLVVLLVRHCRTTSTPASISRVSRWTFLTQAFADAVAFVIHASFGIIAESRASMSLLGPGFLSCVLLINEAQYSILIHQVQAPEDTALTEVANSNASPGSQYDVVAPMSTEHSEVSRIARLIAFLARLRNMVDPHARFWIILTGCLALCIQVLMHPIFAFWIIGTIYSFMWLPQIIRSARRNVRKAMSKRYVVGTSLCRQFFALYVFGCPENIVGIEPTRWIWFVSVSIFLQVVVLVLQEYLGPAFFLPHGWLSTPPYDYHPPMALPDTEAPEHSLGDCSICMETIFVFPEASGGKNGRWTAVAGRRSYSLAPCHHLFHTQCLEKWLTIKSICPQCRRPLPAL